MVLAQMVVDSVVLEGRSIRATALRYGVSKSLVHKQVARYREGGAAAIESRSKAPRSNSRAISFELEELILATRKDLMDRGADAVAETIHYHLEVGGRCPPSTSTIYRVSKRRGFVTPEPRKRPRAIYIRFQADLPNECWQSDMTHWHLSDGTGVEILTFLDDHSRLALSCELFVTVKAGDVRSTFTRTCERFGVPASVLTDNGASFNGRSRGGRTGFESDLLRLGVLYKHSTPYHPQTCGKVERWHRTLKGFLLKRPAATMLELQLILDETLIYYNDVRPHRACARRPPRVAYEAPNKMPAGSLINQPHHRIRHDVVDSRGHVKLCYVGKLRHLNVEWAHQGQPIRLYIVDNHVDVVTENGELVGEIALNVDRDYQSITRTVPL